MANWIIEENVDLANAPKQSTAPYELMFPGDEKAHTWKVHVFENKVEADLSGCSVSAYFLRADGDTIVVTGAIDGNTVTVELAQACYAITGVVQAGLRLTNDGVSFTLSYKLFNVLPTYDSESYVDPGEVIPSIADLLDAIEDMEAATAAAESAASHSVVYDTAQTLTDAQKVRARTNIGLNVTDDGNGNITFS